MSFDEDGISHYGVRLYQPDHSEKVCAVCQTEFSFFKRRHHCRGCRLLVCDGCSQQAVRIGSKKKSIKIRTCERCVYVLKLPVTFQDNKESTTEKPANTEEVASRSSGKASLTTTEYPSSEIPSTPSTPPTPPQVASIPSVDEQGNKHDKHLLPPQTPNTVRRNRQQQQEEASHELVAALRQIELLQASLESRENVDQEEDLTDALRRCETYEVKCKELSASLERKTKDHQTIVEQMKEEMDTLRNAHEVQLLPQQTQPPQQTQHTQQIPNVAKDLMRQHSVEIAAINTTWETRVDAMKFSRARELEELRQRHEQNTMSIMDKHSSLLEQLRSATLHLSEEEKRRGEIARMAQEEKEAAVLFAQNIAQEKMQTLQVESEENVAKIQNVYAKKMETLRSEKNTEMSVLQESAEKRRVCDLEAAQAGHHQIMAFHLKSQEDVAEKKLSKVAAEFDKQLQTTHSKHKEAVVKVRRQSVVQIKTMETDFDKKTRVMKDEYACQLKKAKDHVKRKVRDYERNRTKRKLIKQQDKHSKLVLHREKISARRAIRQRVSQLQHQIVKVEYPRGCFCCGIVFTMFLRVHHCRSCGLAVCDSCSQNRIASNNLRLTQDQLRDALAKDDTVGCSGSSSGSAKIESSVLTEAALEEHGGGGWADLEREEQVENVEPFLSMPLRVCDLCHSSSDMLKWGADEEVEDDIRPSMMSDTASRRGSMIAESVMSDATYLSEIF